MPAVRHCAFQDCQRPARAKGFCAGHYRQLRRGNGLTPLRPRHGKSDDMLRVIPWVRDAPDDAMYDPDSQALIGPESEVIDWMASRNPDMREGPKVARTVRRNGRLRAFWYGGFLEYAMPSEVSAVRRILEIAVLEKYGGEPLGFSELLLLERSEKA